MSALALLRRPAVGPLLGAQLFTALGDNALLIVAIALLEQSGAADWMSPALRICLYLSYVVLAPFAGGLADGMPKGRLIVLVNLAKLGGCILLAARIHPLVAFGAIGVAGVCYGPAKYGILAELVPEADLVLANAWIEVVTVIAILGGAALGAALLNASVWAAALHTGAHQAALLLGGLFVIAALWATAIPATACGKVRDAKLVASFGRQLETLWHDAQGQVSLAVTALFWAVAAVLQFLVIRWAEAVLHLSLGEAALLQCCLAAGVVAGSLGVARFVAASGALRVLPAGAALGLAIVLVSQVTQLWVACLALGATGIVAGVVMVPMNALLQERGNALMRPGASIAVQGFSENLASLVFLGVYGMLLTLGVPLRAIIVGFGLLVTALMLLIRRRGQRHHKHFRERPSCP
jgi:MFS transporter, LPLT family, lysophospholipid transporter